MQIKTTLQCKGNLLSLESPKIMGILNLTPDSFFDGGKFTEQDSILRQTELMLHEGATFIDLGAASSRPGAATLSIQAETDRLMAPLTLLLKHFPDILISVDTTRASIADEALKEGAALINDITAGTGDDAMLTVVARHNVPFLSMHMQGTPQTMQQNPTYNNVTQHIISFFSERITVFKKYGIKDILVDPGFGFGKTIAHNYELLNNLADFTITGFPVVAGISRKGMIYKALGTSPQEALNGTTALHMVALQNGASILRVHDVKEAMECLKLHELLKLHKTTALKYS
jgi:dihydropteroate synthase